ncbi:MAG: HAMP domain-containing sensor histidine kinase [Oscillospiraceae bacterium]|nr:HAMP domain-containing sensor histidine kinase [Oscillospiraceae bacterium]
MFDKKWEGYRALYAGSVLPSVFTDSNLSVFWTNDAARAFQIDFLPESLLLIMGDAQAREALSRLSRGESFESACANALSSPLFLIFTPVFDGDSLLGSVVQLSRESRADSAPTRDAAQALSIFSSQFRTPLSAIFTALFSLSDRLDIQSDPEAGESLGCIAASSYRLFRSAINITETGKYLHGQSSFRPARQDICRFLQGLCENAAMMIRPIGVSLSCHLPSHGIVLPFDGNKLSYAILNLLSNACKFSKEESAVSLSLEQINDRVLITVCDRGCGIEPDRLADVFTPYYSYDPDTGAPCGDGLGLTLVKYIAAEHGGTVAIRSSVGEGTSVSLSLPVDGEASEDLFVGDSPYITLANRFSNVHIVLSDVCDQTL